MKIVAERVIDTEPCWGLYEGPAMVPVLGGASDWRWVQDVTVIRSDRKAHHVTDLGAPEDFEYVTPIMIPSFGENTVQELQYLAEQNRQDHYWQKRAEEMLSESTMIRDVINQEEEIHQVIRNRSILGPSYTIQRNGYPTEATERKLRAKREKYYGRVIPR